MFVASHQLVLVLCYIAGWWKFCQVISYLIIIGLKLAYFEMNGWTVTLWTIFHRQRKNDFWSSSTFKLRFLGIVCCDYCIFHSKLAHHGIIIFVTIGSALCDLLGTSRITKVIGKKAFDRIRLIKFQSIMTLQEALIFPRTFLIIIYFENSMENTNMFSPSV